MNFVDVAIGLKEDPQLKDVRITDQRKQLEIEGRLLRIGFAAIAFGLGALYAADNIKTPERPMAATNRFFPAPLL